MAFVINTNLNSNQALRALNQNQVSLSKTFERLASGTRINGASDDAAGLSIGTRMEAQVRGITKAVGNANDAVSLSQTADSALNEVTNVLQRIRELTVQAASDINSAEDRQKIQTEIDELVKEVDRIGQGEFNGKSLFGGRFDFQLGSNATQNSSVSLSSQKLASNRLGSYSRDTTGDVDTTLALYTNDLNIIKSDGTSVAVRPTTADDDAVSTVNQEGSAIAKAAAINSGTEYHGVTAQVNATTFIAPDPIGHAVFTEDYNVLAINGVEIKDITVLAKDADGTLTEAINAHSEKTGVVASVNNDGHLQLIAEDGRNIEVKVIGFEAGNLGTGIYWYGSGIQTLVQGGTLTLESKDQYTLSGLGIFALGSVGPEVTPANIARLETGRDKGSYYYPGSKDWDAVKDVISINGTVGEYSYLKGKFIYITFPNKRARLHIPNSSGNHLGSPKTSTIRNGSSFELTYDSLNLTIEIDNLESLDTLRPDDGVDAFRFMITSYGDLYYPVEAVMSKNFDETTLTSIDVSNTESAESALKTVDIALDEINAQRSKLGALNNHLESAINNLEQTKNNVAGAKSQIMDADFAAETAQLSKSQIVQQVGISVLSQANFSQEIVLDLL